MKAYILSLNTPSAPVMGFKGQILSFVEYAHVAYQY